MSTATMPPTSKATAKATYADQVEAARETAIRAIEFYLSNRATVARLAATWMVKQYAKLTVEPLVIGRHVWSVDSAGELYKVLADPKAAARAAHRDRVLRRVGR